MSVALVSSVYLDENSTKIRNKTVPWEAYQRADLITVEELGLIKKVDRQPRTRVESVLLSEGSTYAQLYLSLLKKVNRNDTQQCLLVWIADALTDHEERIPLFTRTNKADPDLPYLPLLKSLEATDEFVQLKAAQILTVLLSVGESGALQQYLQPFLQTLAQFVTNPAPHKRDIGVQCLECLLARYQVRQAVWANSAIVPGLLDMLRNAPGPQISYQVVFCFWLLTFEQNIAEQIDKKYDIIPVLVEVAKSAVKEKVIRVVVATFRNLVTKAPSSNLPAMFVAQLLQFAKNLSQRKWSDEDVVEDVQFLKEELTNHFQNLTTYDEYTSELASGHLSWTPVHESDDFWKENATRLNEKDHEQLKLLIHILNTSADPNILAVAANDIGQYVKHYDRGKKFVTDLGGKARVMELMAHTNPDVRYRALLSVQQLVSQPWLAA
ncbi:ATPase, V1 complex, subunit H [Macrolepiota fuliginosa MF-IS2]|uniref:V-type proton ATPase subunit H n=1 Tax=Macrolepiota fuliginosa MF-IS2 TaxID=1400762 RepID=A0A9P5XNJ9_9AGAR|nr:ATPase, V1 complex, subunit H [Macrolepiota fuliginosa MF-IS2]